MRLTDRLMHGWNAFLGRDPTIGKPAPVYGYTETFTTSRLTVSGINARDMINAALNRISVDVAALSVEHARVDEQRRYKEPMNTSLQECLSVAANLDQTSRMFIQDCVMTMLTEGVAAIVPTEATDDPRLTASYDIGAMRVGTVTHWYPRDVQVSLYNDMTGKRELKTFPKSMVAICENPFYEIMNRKNSTYQLLLTKLRQLDTLDSQSSSGKLDLLIQVPYTTKNSTHKEQAESRRKAIENQLNNSQLGIAYIDGTEKVIQLNRAVENNLFAQVEYYTARLFNQLGIPTSVFDGTADEKTMLNYKNQTLEPLISAIVDAMNWKFLTKKARTQGQAIVFFNDPFKFATESDIANNADKFIRNEILTKNEFRQIIGFKPMDDPTADILSNPNMPDDKKALNINNVNEDNDKNNEKDNEYNESSKK